MNLSEVLLACACVAAMVLVAVLLSMIALVEVIIRVTLRELREGARADSGVRNAARTARAPADRDQGTTATAHVRRPVATIQSSSGGSSPKANSRAVPTLLEETGSVPSGKGFGPTVSGPDGPLGGRPAIGDSSAYQPDAGRVHEVRDEALGGSQMGLGQVRLLLGTLSGAVEDRRDRRISFTKEFRTELERIVGYCQDILKDQYQSPPVREISDALQELQVKIAKRGKRALWSGRFVKDLLITLKGCVGKLDKAVGAVEQV